ncbi:hypothetical protein FHY11_002158 [Xanthomonas arboricola]|uniref:OprD family outer membrane porin n=1 Tax=Xanthomonas euroxanthea TaxID=2259622 RepID=UPI00141A98F4|nr:OprD family outer membrane porin [Xanthomonas euroxanthea]MBB3777802.1 hypothetical protein [Xanthomonas euroxanthea]NIK08648.1 hypothetical protein [Xanthomonas euroxanthea]
MNSSCITPTVWLALLLGIGNAHAAENAPQPGAITGGTVDLTALNYYYNRDFRSGAGPSQRTEWAQGVLLSVKSGWTPGVVGFGLDALGVLDVKLDGVASKEGIGLLPMDNGRTRNAFGRIGLTAKARLAESDLHWGLLIPQEPILTASISRIMPQTFNGTVLRSRDIPGLDLSLARYTSTWYRDGVGSRPLTVFNKNNRYAGTPDADHFDMVSAKYSIGKTMVLRYQVGTLDGIYRQQMLGAANKAALRGGTLTSELRYFLTDDVGAARAGRIDNRMFNAMVTYGRGANEWGMGLQRLSGATAMPWVNGTDGNVFNWTFINDFLEAQERSWQARYIFNGDSAGLAGWRFLLRYVHGSNAHPATIAGEGREWQRDIEIDYRFQHAALKHFSLHWINGTLRSNFQRDAEENRIILRYERPLRRADGD